MLTRITLRQLEYLIAVGEAGSIAAASERVNVSSPSISAAISQLEAELGVKIFIRQHAQGLSPTPGGRRILAEAREILQRTANLNDIANEINDAVRGPLSVGCLVTFAPLISASLRRSFEAAHSEASLTLRDGHHANLLDMLGRAEIDLALTYDLEIPADVSFTPLASLPPHVVLPVDHRLAGRNALHLAELADENFILLDLPQSRDYFLSLFSSLGLRPRVAERTGELSITRSLVANGFGYGLINIHTVTQHAPDGEGVVVLPLKDSLRALNLGIAHAAGLQPSRLMQAFEAHVRDRIADGSLPGLAPPAPKQKTPGS